MVVTLLATMALFIKLLLDHGEEGSLIAPVPLIISVPASVSFHVRFSPQVPLSMIPMLLPPELPPEPPPDSESVTVTVTEVFILLS